MPDQEIILYHYTYSPYARRVVWYLTLRGIQYSQCLQPPMMPRPDVSRLGIAYRRIPLLSIGQDVYLDTRLQLSKLEELFPELPRLGASNADQQAVQRLLSTYVIDGGVFARAAQLLPTDLPVMKDPKWAKDRADFSGSTYSTEALDRVRPEALREMSHTFDLLETTLLADGRDWLLKTDGPGLADIEAVWPLHWMTGMKGALPGDMFSETIYPKVYAWIARFQKAVSQAKKTGPKPKTLNGEEAAKTIRGSQYNEKKESIDGQDPMVKAQGLAKGDVVTVWPTDTGSAHRDVGKLVGLDKDEVVFEVLGDEGSVRVHAPRHGFRFRKGGEKKGGKL